MNNKNKTILCLIGIIVFSQIQWFIPKAEIFNGIVFIFGIGFGYYASQYKQENSKELKENKEND